MFDEKFWIAISLIVFIGALYKKISGIVTKSIDEKISSIKSQLQKATLINQEAQNIRDNYLLKKKESNAKAKQLIKNAELAAHKLVFKNEEFLKDITEKKTAATKLLISEMEKKCLKELHVQVALRAVKKYKDYINSNNHDELFYKRSIEFIKKAI
jgi:F0F1-type ATP synthase membrane subunit b/b'